jgi:hypothetical protein
MIIDHTSAHIQNALPAGGAHEAPHNATSGHQSALSVRKLLPLNLSRLGRGAGMALALAVLNFCGQGVNT